jgi:hypothetical protein
MSETQSYQNHKRYVPAYHYYTAAGALAVLVWAIYRVIQNFSLDRIMMLLLVVVVILVSYWARAFALGAQDRIIRLEERLRLATIVPDPLRSRIDDLAVSQLIALRFASDAEAPGLMKRVLDENITDSNQIKLLIKDWRADHVRV